MNEENPAPEKPRQEKPKIRKRWAINPKTRVKESEKLYDRAKEKLDEHRAIDEVIDYFGE